MTQNYRICQAAERPVQTILDSKNCNVLEMNLLEFVLVQTYFEGSPRNLGIIPPISSYPKDVAEAF